MTMYRFIFVSSVGTLVFIFSILGLALLVVPYDKLPSWLQSSDDLLKILGIFACIEFAILGAICVCAAVEKFL